jgi:hypothetical protein
MKQTIATTLLLLLLGGSQETVIQKNMSPVKTILAELQAAAIHTCQSAVNLSKAPPVDFNAILGSGNYYTDNTFLGSDTMTWPEYKGGGSYGLSSYLKYTTFKRARAVFPQTIWGEGESFLDVT